jgi:hypothetical protein
MTAISSTYYQPPGWMEGNKSDRNASSRLTMPSWTVAVLPGKTVLGGERPCLQH